MSVHHELTHARHALDDLLRAVERLQIPLGDGPDIRRIASDANRLREDLDLLRQNGAAEQATPDPVEIVFIPRTPYDPSMWVGCEDEGIGARHGAERRQTRTPHRFSRRASRMA